MSIVMDKLCHCDWQRRCGRLQRTQRQPRCCWRRIPPQQTPPPYRIPKLALLTHSQGLKHSGDKLLPLIQARNQSQPGTRLTPLQPEPRIMERFLHVAASVSSKYAQASVVYTRRAHLLASTSPTTAIQRLTMPGHSGHKAGTKVLTIGATSPQSQKAASSGGAGSCGTSTLS